MPPTLRWRRSKVSNANFLHFSSTVYHHFSWYATLENITPEETFPKFLSTIQSCYQQNGSKSTNYSPLAWRKEGLKVTLVAVIGGFRSDLNNMQDWWKFWKRFCGCFVFQSHVSTKMVVNNSLGFLFLDLQSTLIPLFALMVFLEGTIRIDIVYDGQLRF